MNFKIYFIDLALLIQCMMTGVNSLYAVEKAKCLYHFVVTGQSNAFGLASGLPLSTTAIFDNIFQMTNARGEFVLLTEPAFHTHGITKSETSLSGAAAKIESILRSSLEGSESKRKILFSVHADGGVGYDKIRKNGAGYSYEDSIEAVKAAKEYADSIGFKCNVPSVILIHGESDALAGNQNYKNNLLELQRNYNTDIKAITKQKNAVKLFLVQTYGYELGPSGSTDSSMDIKVAQIKAAKENADIVLVGPSGFLPADGTNGTIHMSNSSYRRLGEYIGKVAAGVIFLDRHWEPLTPRKVVVQKNIVTVNYHVPVVPLRFDRTMEAENYGFEFYDSGKMVPITAVNLKGTRTVELMLKDPPCGKEQFLYYGNAVTDLLPNGGGALIDSDASPSLYGYDLSNRCVDFRYKIVGGKGILQ